MFTKKVTDDDNFMALSSSAQALYLHLSMAADDDGFCNQVSISMFKAHASIQDLQALLEKRYIYQFDNGVIVIKHWRMANALRKDRYTPTAFQEELTHLDLKKNGSYTWLPNGCQMVAERLPQDRLGKDSIDKDIIDVLNSAEAEPAPPIKKIDYQEIIDLYHDKCTSYPTVKKISDARKKAIKARLNSYSVDDFQTLFEKAEASDFLKGGNDRNWQATFDWLIKDANMAKVLEGNYDNRPKQTRRNGYNTAPQRKYDMDAMEGMLLRAQNPAPTVDDDAGLKAEADELQRMLQEKYAKSV